MHKLPPLHAGQGRPQKRGRRMGRGQKAMCLQHLNKQPGHHRGLGEGACSWELLLLNFRAPQFQSWRGCPITPWPGTSPPSLPLAHLSLGDTPSHEAVPSNIFVLKGGYNPRTRPVRPRVEGPHFQPYLGPTCWPESQNLYGFDLRD